MNEEFKSLPWQEVFDMCCLRQGILAGADWIGIAGDYGKRVLSKR